MLGARTRKELHEFMERDRIAEARQRYGRPFAHERGTEFKWTSGPTVLKEWLRRIEAERRGR